MVEDEGHHDAGALLYTILGQSIARNTGLMGCLSSVLNPQS